MSEKVSYGEISWGEKSHTLKGVSVKIVESISQQRDKKLTEIYQQRQAEAAAKGTEPPQKSDLVVSFDSLRTRCSDNAHDIFFTLLKVLPPEGRHYVINGIANHLRYPNSHTFFFSNLILKLFLEAEEDFCKEQIIRVLAERSSAKPVPYGVQVALQEITTKKQYHHHNLSFANSNSNSKGANDVLSRNNGGNSEAK